MFTLKENRIALVQENYDLFNEFQRITANTKSRIYGQVGNYHHGHSTGLIREEAFKINDLTNQNFTTMFVNRYEAGTDSNPRILSPLYKGDYVIAIYGWFNPAPTYQINNIYRKYPPGTCIFINANCKIKYGFKWPENSSGTMFHIIMSTIHVT